MNKKIITFTNIYGENFLYPPEPASSNIPEWYLSLDSYIGKEKGITEKQETNGTIKRCMPVFDAITMGYIIKTPSDLYISHELTPEGHLLPKYNWPKRQIVDFHVIEQAPTHPLRFHNKFSYPKWLNPWSIKTEPGYSCLFIQPVHRDLDFTIFSGVVDTDTYHVPVNIPFTLNNKNFNGLIPAGTPMVQVIPFKRESFSMRFGGKKELGEQQEIFDRIKTRFFDGYKALYRYRKEYK